MKMKKREYEQQYRDWLAEAKRRRAAIRDTRGIDIVSWFIILASLGIVAILIWFNGPSL
jgi:hypothetical protein